MSRSDYTRRFVVSEDLRYARPVPDDGSTAPPYFRYVIEAVSACEARAKVKATPHHERERRPPPPAPKCDEPEPSLRELAARLIREP